MGVKKSKTWEFLTSVKEKLLTIVIITGCMVSILGAIATYFIYPALNKTYVTKTEMENHIKLHKH